MNWKKVTLGEIAAYVEAGWFLVRALVSMPVYCTAVLIHLVVRVLFLVGNLNTGLEMGCDDFS